MGANLSLTQAGGKVVFEMQFRVELAATRSSPSPQGSVADDFAAAPFPSGLNICCLDDSEAARRLLYHNLVAHAQTDAVRTFGANEEEVAEFMDVVLTEGDIAILDQHLEYGGDTNLLGTDIVAKLLQGGFQGLICMRSGNTADDDVSKYRTAGAHCVFGKDIPMKQMIARMKEAYHTHCVERHSTASIRVEDIASSSCSPAMMCACGHSV
jgi:DNA-binding response OmpR family regulator